jgi:general secretion pathway protein K
MTGGNRERGAALVITLVFVTAMAAAAVAFLAGRRTDALTLRGQLQAIEAQAMLDAALQQTVTLLANRQPRQMVPPQLSWQFGEVAVRVRFERESGKIDLNAASDPMLRALPLALGLDEASAAEFADVVQDWRDENQLRLTSGAEDRDYRSGGSAAGGAADRPFANPAELRYLPVVDPTLWSMVEPYITVYSGAAEPSTRYAAGPVREAVKIARGLKADDPDQESTDDANADGLGADSEADGARSERDPLTDGAPGSRAFGRGDRSRTTGGLSRERDSLGVARGLDGDANQRGREAGDGEAGGDGAGGGDETGPQSVLLDVRFSNGYEAAARAVIALAGGNAGAPPVVVLDWTPILRARGDAS